MFCLSFLPGLRRECNCKGCNWKCRKRDSSKSKEHTIALRVTSTVPMGATVTMPREKTALKGITNHTFTGNEVFLQTCARDTICSQWAHGNADLMSHCSVDVESLSTTTSQCFLHSSEAGWQSRVEIHC